MDTYALVQTLGEAFPQLVIDIELEDIINLEADSDYFAAIEEDLVDLVNSNGWFVGFRDVAPGKVHLALHPDTGIDMGPPPPVLYHITLEDNLSHIKKHGLKLGTGGDHGITYSPRIFVSDDPLNSYGLPFSDFDRIAIVAIKTWLIPDHHYYRDPNFWDAGWGAASVIDSIPAHALVVPSSGFLKKELGSPSLIPKVKIPKRVAVRYWARLARRSKTPLRTAFYNTAGTLVTDALYKSKRASQSPLGQKLERFMIEGAARHTPSDHPWAAGAPWWYEHDPKPHGPQLRYNPDRLPMPIYLGEEVSPTKQVPLLLEAFKSFTKVDNKGVVVEKLPNGLRVETPRSKDGGFSYIVLIESESDYTGELEGDAYVYRITPHYLLDQNEEALNSVFRLLFMGDEYLDPFLRPGPKTLTPPQARVYMGFERSYDRGERAGAVLLPTGVGKTIIASKIIQSLHYNYHAIPKRFLFLAGIQEILDQAIISLQAENPWMTKKDIGRFYGSRVNKKKLLERKAVFATPQSLRFIDFEELGPDYFDVIVIDEFHHVNAPIYNQVVEYFNPRYVLGLTATPFRGDAKEPLAKVGYNVLYAEEEWELDRRETEKLDRAPTMKLADAISLGYIVPFDVISLVDSSTYYTRRDEQIKIKDLHKYMFPERDRYIVHAYKKYLRKVQTVAFCKSRAQAHHVSEVFRKAGVRNEVILGGPGNERDEKLEGFRKGRYPLLIVVDVINEGVDVPNIEGILYLRNIESMRVILQQVGRGLRRSPGKRVLKIVDLFNNVDLLRAFLKKENIPIGMSVIRTPSAGKITQTAPPPLQEGGTVDLDIEEVEHKVQPTLAKTRTARLYTFWKDAGFTQPYTWEDLFPGHRRGTEQLSYKAASLARKAVNRARDAGYDIYVDPDPFVRRRLRRKK